MNSTALTGKDLLLPNTINQKDEKPHTAIPHFKIQITEIPLEQKAQYRNTVIPHFPLHTIEEVIENLGLKHLMFTIFDNIIIATSFHLSMLVC